MKIITRESWGAAYAAGFGPAPVPFAEWWLHHSDTKAPGDDPAAEAAAMRELERIGQERFGGGISYTYAVMPSGRVYEGTGVDRQGAHTRNRNDIARAVVLVGNYDVDHVTPAQVEAVAGLLVQCWRREWCPTPYLNGGHRQAPGAATACPGRFGEAAVDVINDRAEQIARAGHPTTHQEEEPMALSDADAELLAAKVWAHSLGATRGGGVELPAQSARERVNALHRLNVLQKARHGELMAQLSALGAEELAAAVPLDLAGQVVAELARRLHEAPPPAAPAAVHTLTAAPAEDAPAETVPPAFAAADAAAGAGEPAIPATPSYLAAEPADTAAPHAAWPFGASA